MAGQPQQLTPTQAQDLAQQFHDVAAAIGNYRLAHVGQVSPAQQYHLQNQQLLCIQYSNNFITEGLSLQQSDLAQTLQSIKQATSQAEQAISTIETVDKVLQIVAAAAVLGASIASMNPSAIGTGVQGVITSVIGDTDGAAAVGAASGSSTDTASGS